MSIEEIARQMVVKGKGILAADESTGTMEKRLMLLKTQTIKFSVPLLELNLQFFFH